VPALAHRDGHEHVVVDGEPRASGADEVLFRIF
jgi:hypothetical protein